MNKNQENRIILSAKNLSKSFDNLNILDNVNLEIKAGEITAIIGASGSGKSTLLHLLAGLDNPSSGDVYLLDNLINNLDNNKQAELRNKYLGFIYQFHHLLPELTALENVAIPLLIRRLNISESQNKASLILEKLNLKNRLNHKPSQLSGGERQRVAIARALITNPSCVFADEPTGNLDNKTADEVFNLMLSLAKENNISFIIVTHDKDLASKCDKVLHLINNKLEKL